MDYGGNSIPKIDVWLWIVSFNVGNIILILVIKIDGIFDNTLPYVDSS